jgi:hypothetical protein
MRTLRRWLIRVLLWLVARLQPTETDSPLRARARALTALWEARTQGKGFGEMKRHNVLSQLIKEYPTVGKRELSRVIEEALP